MEKNEIHKQLLDDYISKFNRQKEEMLNLIMFEDFNNEKIAKKASEMFFTSKSIEFLKEKVNG